MKTYIMAALAIVGLSAIGAAPVRAGFWSESVSSNQSGSWDVSVPSEATVHQDAAVYLDTSRWYNDGPLGSYSGSEGDVLAIGGSVAAAEYTVYLAVDGEEGYSECDISW